jgi:predicted NBD/HSP70 family sugar kinase
LPFLNQSPLIIDLEKQTHLPTTLINDAQAALVGEVNFGAAKGCRNVVLVTLGTGIGGGVMIDGKIYLGHNGTAGSFGWLLAPVRVFPNPEHGPWERWASGNSLLNASRDLGLSVSELLQQAIDAPDSQASGVLTDFSSRIGKGLGSIASLFDPQIILVSGGLVDSWSLLGNGVQEGFKSTASPSVRNTPIKVAILGSDAGAVGASVTARNYFNSHN